MTANLLASIAGCPNVSIIKYMGYRINSVWTGVFALVVALSLVGFDAYAQGLRPYEPLNPAKAQSLPQSPLIVESDEMSHHFVVELADSPDEHSIGLMHRNFLAADRGMLFFYDRPHRARFWMRNTFISLDMLFIRSDGEIAYIAENTVPHSETTVGPRQRVQAVLEVPAGTVAKLGIELGDKVRHQIFGNLPDS